MMKQKARLQVLEMLLFLLLLLFLAFIYLKRVRSSLTIMIIQFDQIQILKFEITCHIAPLMLRKLIINYVV